MAAHGQPDSASDTTKGKYCEYTGTEEKLMNDVIDALMQDKHSSWRRELLQNWTGLQQGSEHQRQQERETLRRMLREISIILRGLKAKSERATTKRRRQALRQMR